MKLIRCYIENFGKLHNFSYNFNDGLNIIEKENGFGKTTFATFIKSMFYGLDSSKSEKSERKKYTPWQGGIFGGNIEFEIDGKNYRIERFFGSKAAEDSFKIYDLTTNLETKDFSQNIGEEIFKINKEGYERSTYIPQGQIQIEMEDSLNAKLGNILEGDNDVNTSDEAIKKLSELMKIYKKIGNKGLLNEKKNLLNEKQRELEKNKFDNENLEIKEKKLNEVKKQISEYEAKRIEKQTKLSEKIEEGRKQAKIETYNNILDKLKEKQARYDELNAFLNDGNPQGSEFQTLNLKISEIEDKIKVENENQEELKIKENDLKILQKKQIKLWKIAKIISLFFIIIGIILLFLNIPKWIGLLPGVIGLAALVFSIIKYKDKNIKYQIENLKKAFEDIDKNIESLNMIKQEVEDNKNRMLAYFRSELTSSLAELENTKIQKNDFELQNNIKELMESKTNIEASEQELNQDIINLSNTIDNLVDEKNQVKNQVEFLENKIDENEYLETDILRLKEEISNLEKKYKILDQTKELLEKAKNTFSSNYLKDMSEGFEKYFKLIDDKDFKTNIDINLDVKLDVNGSKKEVKYFSAGYKDLIYICMRFSLVDALFKDELPFVILDDPFVNLDNEKTKKAIDLIKEFSKQYQVIYFVCNDSRT